MSEARKMHDQKVTTESGEYEVRLARPTDANLFTTITEKVSDGLEQVAGFIHEKTQGQDEASKINEYGQRTASALHSSANYIRQADLEQMQQDLRGAIKRHPERSLLIGVGVGVALGLIFRKKG